MSALHPIFADILSSFAKPVQQPRFKPTFGWFNRQFDTEAAAAEYTDGWISYAEGEPRPAEFGPRQMGWTDRALATHGSDE